MALISKHQLRNKLHFTVNRGRKSNENSQRILMHLWSHIHSHGISLNLTCSFQPEYTILFGKLQHNWSTIVLKFNIWIWFLLPEHDNLLDSSIQSPVLCPLFVREAVQCVHLIWCFLRYKCRCSDLVAKLGSLFPNSTSISSPRTFPLPEHYNLLDPAIQFPVPQPMQLVARFLSWSNHPASAIYLKWTKTTCCHFIWILTPSSSPHIYIWSHEASRTIIFSFSYLIRSSLWLPRQYRFVASRNRRRARTTGSEQSK